MKKCSNCGTENESSSHFCESCGKALNNSGTTNCVNCGHEIAKDTNYCPYCGVCQHVVYGNAVEPTNEIFKGQREEPKKISHEETTVIVIIAIVIIAVIIISFCLMGNKKTGNTKIQDTTMVDSACCDSVVDDVYPDSVATPEVPTDSSYVVDDYGEQNRVEPQEEEEPIDGQGNTDESGFILEPTPQPTPEQQSNSSNNESPQIIKKAKKARSEDMEI